jgi:hypothetical protein
MSLISEFKRDFELAVDTAIEEAAVEIEAIEVRCVGCDTSKRVRHKTWVDRATIRNWAVQHIEDAVYGEEVARGELIDHHVGFRVTLIPKLENIDITVEVKNE